MVDRRVRHERMGVDVGTYSIWLLQCGIMKQFPVSGMFQGAHNEGIMEVPLGYLVVAGEGHVALIDTGYKYLEYGQELADLYGVETWRSPDELLGHIGFTPADVDTLIVTHAHWDHMGYVEAFPNATIWLQRSELSGWLEVFGLPTQFSFLKGGVDPADFHHLLERAMMGQVRLIDGTMTDVLPGIDLHPAHDTHTPGCQYAVIRSDGPDAPGWVAVGDVVFQYANLEGRDGSGEYSPTGQVMGSLTRLMMSFDEILTHAGGNIDRVIPVHDLKAYERFPSEPTFPGLQVAEVVLADGAASRLGQSVGS